MMLDINYNKLFIYEHYLRLATLLTVLEKEPLGYLQVNVLHGMSFIVQEFPKTTIWRYMNIS